MKRLSDKSKRVKELEKSSATPNRSLATPNEAGAEAACGLCSGKEISD